MIRHRYTYLVIICAMMLCLAVRTKSYAQHFELPANRNRVSIPFKMVRNMIIIRIKINGRGPFNFVLDTGVGTMVITDPALDSLSITQKRLTKLAGLGRGDDFDAYITGPLNVDVNGIYSVNVGAFIFTKDHFGLSNYAGIPVHGLLGYEFFSNLVVKVDFADSTLTAYRPEKFRKPGRYQALPITIEKHKPYITTPVVFCDNSQRDCKLVVDLGAGHPLSLENDSSRRWPTKQSIPANLGMGLTGPISGKLSRISSLTLGKYILNNILSSFPENLHSVFTFTPRDGNIGTDILKRFTLIFDYSDSMIYLKSRGNLTEPFEHDMSGMEYYVAGDDYDHVVVSRVEPGSASDAVGLAKDDEIVSVNLKPVSKIGLEELDRLFRSGNGRGLLIEVYHDKQYSMVVLTLKRRI